MAEEIEINIQNLEDVIDELKSRSVKLNDLKEITNMLASALQELAPISSFVLHNTPEAKNFLVFNFTDDLNPDRAFQLILRKKGGDLSVLSEMQ